VNALASRFLNPLALVPMGLAALAATLGFVVLAPGSAAVGSGRAQIAQAARAAPSSDDPCAPLKGDIAAGCQLFQEHCASCHGANAEGSGVFGPSLENVGSATVDLWLSAGWMPLKNSTDQPEPKPPQFPPDQIKQIVDYVASLFPGKGPGIPSYDLKNANLAEGFSLFVLNCAPCHTVTGAGDALFNVDAPTMHGVPPGRVAEAIHTGPGNMPQFVPGVLTEQEANDVIAYVTGPIQHPTNPGGLALGGIGPVAEGFVGLFVGVGATMLVAFWVGDRTERDEDEGEGEGSEHQAHGEGGLADA
jgi:ubiquinol-cytochrome c reductase cytochrome c subunit